MLSCLYCWRVVFGRNIECPGHRLADRLDLRRHAEPVVLEMPVRLAGRVDHLDYDDRLVAGDIPGPESAVTLIVVEARPAGVAHEGGRAVDFFTAFVPFNHDTTDFGVLLGVDFSEGDLER